MGVNLNQTIEKINELMGQSPSSIGTQHGDLCFANNGANAIDLKNANISGVGAQIIRDTVSTGPFLNYFLDEKLEWDVLLPAVRPVVSDVVIDCFGPNLTSSFNIGFLRNLSISKGVKNLLGERAENGVFCSILCDFNQVTYSKFLNDSHHSVTYENLKSVQFYQEQKSLSWRQVKMEKLHDEILILAKKLGVDIKHYIPQSFLTKNIIETGSDFEKLLQNSYSYDSYGNYSYFALDVAYFSLLSRLSTTVYSVYGHDQIEHMDYVKQQIGNKVNLIEVTHGLVNIDSDINNRLVDFIFNNETLRQEIDALSLFFMSVLNSKPININNYDFVYKQIVKFKHILLRPTNDYLKDGMVLESLDLQSALSIIKFLQKRERAISSLEPSFYVNACSDLYYDAYKSSSQYRELLMDIATYYLKKILQ